MASVTNGKCIMANVIMAKIIYGKNIMANETEPIKGKVKDMYLSVK